jgi:hypothetical protein
MEPMAGLSREAKKKAVLKIIEDSEVQAGRLICHGARE